MTSPGIIVSTRAKLIALAGLVAKSVVLFYLGRKGADFLIHEWPGNTPTIETGVMVVLLLPLMYLVIKPFVAVVFPTAPSGASEGNHGTSSQGSASVTHVPPPDDDNSV